MKALILISMLFSSVAFSAEVPVLDTDIYSTSYLTRAYAKFQMNTTTGQGYARVTVTEESPYYPGPIGCDQWGRCYPRRPMPMPRTVFSEDVEIQGLMLHGKRIVYAGEQGDVDCGYLGESRVFRVPTIYLNGNCELKARMRGNNLRVTLVTK